MDYEIVATYLDGTKEVIAQFVHIDDAKRFMRMSAQYPQETDFHSFTLYTTFDNKRMNSTIINEI